MGYVDTLTKYTHYNSYRLEPGEEIFGTPFDVEFYSAINSQIQVICKGATSEGAMYVTWLAEDGSKLGRDEFEFDVTGRWVQQVWMNEPPENAIRAMWSVQNTHASEAWNVACAMTSAGEMAGAFDPSLAGHVSLLTASGLYTGTVTADQVITGKLLANDGRAWFDLDTPEIVMKGEDATWRASPENPLRLEDEDGTLMGGLVRLPDGRVAFITTALASTGDLSGGFATIGRIAGNRGRGIMFTEDDYSFALREGIWGERDGGVALYVGSERRMEWLGSGAVAVYAPESESFNPGNPVVSSYVYVSPDGQFTIRNGSGLPIRLIVNDDGSAYFQSHNKNHAIGVDDTGPYRIKNGTKTYF